MTPTLRQPVIDPKLDATWEYSFMITFTSRKKPDYPRKTLLCCLSPFSVSNVSLDANFVHQICWRKVGVNNFRSIFTHLFFQFIISDISWTYEAMTISYSGNFLKLLLRWKGSIWRSVWKELIVYLMCYYLIRLFYLVGIPYFFDDDDMRDQMRSVLIFLSLFLKFSTVSRTFTFISNVFLLFTPLKYPQNIPTNF